MRRVKRRFTRRRPKEPAPWTWRPTYPYGAPRTCRSNYRWPVMLKGTDGSVEVGTIDMMLHLYTHWGLTEMSALVKIEEEWNIVYDMKEWGVVNKHGAWIEFVSDSQDVVARISREDAKRHGCKTEHGGQPVWAVPMKHYTKHRRDS